MRWLLHLNSLELLEATAELTTLCSDPSRKGSFIVRFLKSYPAITWSCPFLWAAACLVLPDCNRAKLRGPEAWSAITSINSYQTCHRVSDARVPCTITSRQRSRKAKLWFYVVIIRLKYMLRVFILINLHHRHIRSHTLSFLLTAYTCLPVKLYYLHIIQYKYDSLYTNILFHHVYQKKKPVKLLIHSSCKHLWH